MFRDTKDGHRGGTSLSFSYKVRRCETNWWDRRHASCFHETQLTFNSHCFWDFSTGFLTRCGEWLDGHDGEDGVGDADGVDDEDFGDLLGSQIMRFGDDEKRISASPKVVLIRRIS